tara:strand:+ start:207 stop:347 length:141 start_codon:yes stop_codon:yes gene_type:complete
MVKSIILKLDEAFFFKLKADKAHREKIFGAKIKWEDYIKLLFGFIK